MAKFVLKDAFVSINSVTLSDHIASVEVSTTIEDVDVTAMGATGHNRVMGLRNESVTLTFLQDYAAANVDATLWPLYSAGTSFPIEIRPTSAAASPTNPKWTGNCFITSYPPVSGAVGSRAEASVSLVVDGVLTRATA
jgi:hypothetical protein